MDFRKLEVFCTVVECKSFTKAAEKLFVSQPTVSEHIRGLEHELEHKLFNRLGKEVEVTPIGKLLYTYASKIILIKAEAAQAIAHYGGRLAGTITIGSGTIPGTYLLPVFISAFQRKNPEIKTVLHINSSKIIAENVLSGEFELGIVGARWNNRKLTWSDIFNDELALAVPSDHPLARKKEITLQEAIQFPFILREPESGTRRVFAGILQQANLREDDLSVVAEIGSTAAVKEAVKAGLGISILSRRAVREDQDTGRLAALMIKGQNLSRPFYLVQRKNRELSPVARAFISLMRDYAKQL